jgi:hypothetical protein
MLPGVYVESTLLFHDGLFVERPDGSLIFHFGNLDHWPRWLHVHNAH